VQAFGAMKWATALVAAALVLPAGATVRAAPDTSPRTVPCDEIILRVRSGRGGGYRVVLGVVSVPPAFLEQIVSSGNRQWPFWRKAGLVVRAGAPPVTVSVPRAWRTRAAITWGNSTGIVKVVRLASCPGARNAWNAYAGGFYLRSRSACVPLRFTVAGRSAIIRFGLGRRCS
jgi:hypothetical protein